MTPPTYRGVVEAALAEVGFGPPVWDDDDGWWVAWPPDDAPPGYEDALTSAVNLADPLWPAE